MRELGFILERLFGIVMNHNESAVLFRVEARADVIGTNGLPRLEEKEKDVK
jgi:hypothetical protein